MDQKGVHEALSLAEELLVVDGQWERGVSFLQQSGGDRGKKKT